jgi:hypothetical protein
MNVQGTRRTRCTRFQSRSSAAVSRLSRGMGFLAHRFPWILKTGYCSCFPLEDVAAEDPLLAEGQFRAPSPRLSCKTVGHRTAGFLIEAVARSSSS